MTLRGRFTKALAAVCGLVILLAALSSAGSPAKADIVDCVNALAPIGSAAKLSEMAAKTSACGSEATSNPMMAVVMAVMITLRAQGVFGGSDECNAMVDSVAGSLIGAGLKALGIGGSEIEALILGQLSLSQIPGLGDTLLHFTSCGCAVAGALDDAKAIADEYVNSVNGCGAFAGEAMASIGSGVFSSGWFSHGAGDPGTIDAPPYVCPAGFLGKTPIYNVCENKVSSDPNVPGTMTCSWDGQSYAPTKLGEQFIYNGQVVPCYCEGGATAVSIGATFICKCPGGQGYNADGTCKPCPQGQALGDDGQCRPGNSNEVINLGSWLACGASKVAYQNGAFGFCGPKCEDGTKIDMANTGNPKCIPACSVGTFSMFDKPQNAVFNLATKQCTNCTALGQVAVFKDGSGKTSSNGQCQACGAGYKISFADKNHPTCVPACAEGSVLDAKGVCTDCNKQNKVAVSAAGKGSLGTCQSCSSPLQKRDGNSCVPAKDCESWQRLEIKLGGVGVAGGGSVCVSKCGPGEVYKPGVAGGSKTLTLPDGKTLTTMTPPQPESCTPCGDKQVLDSATNSCGACAAGTVWHAAAGGKAAYCSTPQRVQPVAIPPSGRPLETPKDLPQVIKPLPDVPVATCPPGRVLSASGRCVVEFDNDDAFRGGSSSGARPSGPAGSGNAAPPPVLRTPSPGVRP